MEKLKNELIKLEKQNYDLTNKIYISNQNISLKETRLENMINSYQNEVNNLQLYIKELLNEKANLNTKEQLHLKTINDYVKKLTITEKTLKLNKNNFIQKENQILQLKMNNMSENEINEDNINTLAACKENFYRLQEKLYKSNLEVENYVKLYNDKVKEILVFEKENKELRKEQIKILNEKELLMIDIGNIQKENALLKNQIDNLNKIIHENKINEIEQCTQKNINEKDIFHLNEDNKKLKEMFQIQTMEFENLDKVKNYYSALIRERENKIFEILNENNRLRRDFENLQNNLGTITEENCVLKEKIKDVENKYKKLYDILKNKYSVK